MQSIIYFLSCCILTWIECLILSFVFVVVVVVGMYNLILLTSSICLVDRYQETPVLQNVYMDNSRLANKLSCAKKYQNRHFVLQAGIYIHLMRKNVLYKY